MLDLNDVALFVQVSRNGSFAETSRQLGMPPNTLSRRLQMLETQLGTRLLQRTTRKLTLTAAGQALYDRSGAAIDGLLGAGQALIGSSQAPCGRLRIAAMTDFFELFPMEWVSGFLRDYPLVQLDFLLNDQRPDLISERIDIAFRAGPLTDSGDVGRQLIDAGREGLVASPDYLTARGTPSTVADLLDHHAVCLSSRGVATWRLSGPSGATEEVQLPSRFTANTLQGMRQASLAGLGIALLPAALICSDLKTGRLVPVLPQHYRTSHGVHVLYPSSRQLPLAVSAFIERLLEKLNAVTVGNEAVPMKG